MPRAQRDRSARLHVVTGKGGTGKTTVAVALALALAGRGERVLLVEVEGRPDIADLLGQAPLDATERTLLNEPGGGELVGLCIDARVALLEYLDRYYRIGPARAVLERVGAIDVATSIAPGLADAIVLGKVYDVATRAPQDTSVGSPKGAAKGLAKGAAKGARDSLPYDAIVLDAPPTGRVGRFLGVTGELAELARVGPLRGQADAITALLRGPGSRVHLVTVLEEMPVEETRSAVAELRGLSLPLGSIIATMTQEPLVDDGAQAQLAGSETQAADALGEGLSAAGVEPTRALVTGLLAGARAELARATLAAEQAEVLADLRLPLVRLPLLPDGVGPKGLRHLAGELVRQGVLG